MATPGINKQEVVPSIKIFSAPGSKEKQRTRSELEASMERREMATLPSVRAGDQPPLSPSYKISCRHQTNADIEKSERQVLGEGTASQAWFYYYYLYCVRVI